METITKPVNEVAVGDVVESADAFMLSYMRVTQPPELDAPTMRRQDGTYTESWFVLVGEMVGDGESNGDEWQDGDPGELYIDTSDTVEVVVTEGS